MVEENPLENLEETPPNFEAYQHLLAAKAVYGNKNEYIKLIDAAIIADKTYFEPQVDRIAYYYNAGEYRKADSLRLLLNNKPITSKRQGNLLKMYESLLLGNNRDTYRYLKNEYSIYPDDLETNASIMTVALQFVNRPEDVSKIFSRIALDGLDIEDCAQCKFRYYIKGLAEIELGHYDKAIELLKPFSKSSKNRLLKQVLIMAQIRAAQSDSLVDGTLANVKLLMSTNDWRRLTMIASKEYLRIGNKKRAAHHAQNIIASFDGKDELQIRERRMLGLAHFYEGDYKKAIFYLEKYLKDDPNIGLFDHYSHLAVAYHKTGNTRRAEAILTLLDEKRTPYDYGHIDYALAQYFAATGRNEEAYSHLLKSAADGKWFTSDGYHNDIFFQDIKNEEAFQEITRFWH